MRWLKFGAVGIAGVAVQLSVLWLLARELGVPTIAATVMAVEVAILHNFAWHEAWTWRGLPPEERWTRLLRFHTANGFVSLALNAGFTWLFKENFGAPLLISNLGAIAVTSLLTFLMADRWVFRRAALLLLILPMVGRSAAFTTKLQPETIQAWDKYVEQAEHHPPAGPEPGDDATLVDLNPDGVVRSGYIHHWIGAIQIPNTTVAGVQAVLEDYDRYPQVYAPDVKLASASKTAANAYDVRLVTERSEGIGLRFAFDIRARVNFHDSAVDSRSYSIRESDAGKAPYTDLLPEGNDHGILWRLNSYWRFHQIGNSVTATLEVISLSRKPLIGMGALVKTRARDSVAATLRQTKDRAISR